MIKHHLTTPLFPDLTYFKAGSAGPSLVLIHGFPEDANLWRKVVQPLAMHFQLILPNLPGSTGSSYAGDNLSIEIMADSVAVILAQENVTKATIVGHSMGGYVVLALAKRHSSFLNGLSLIHSSAKADNEEKRQLRDKTVALLQKERGRELFLKQMVPNLFSSHFTEESQQEINEQIALAEQITVESLMAFTLAMKERNDSLEQVSELAIPIQWILGNEDNLISVDDGIQQSSLSDVSFISVYGDCGHMSMIEKPDLLIEDLRKFVDYCVSRSLT